MNAMINDASILLQRERLAARRLARLFRIERAGGFDRRPGDVARRLIERRGRLITELLRLDARRRSLEPWSTGDLELAMAVLQRNVRRCEQYCLERLAEIGAELERRRAAVPTGLRDSAGGRVLGSG